MNRVLRMVAILAIGSGMLATTALPAVAQKTKVLPPGCFFCVSDGQGHVVCTQIPCPQ
jgi:hypothetical protein